MHLLQPGELKDELYRCKVCLMCFMFYSDVDEHAVDTGHASIDIIRLKDPLTR